MKITGGVRKVTVIYEYSDGRKETIQASKVEDWHSGMEVEYDTWTNPPVEHNDRGFRRFALADNGSHLTMKIEGRHLAVSRTCTEPEPEDEAPVAEESV